MRQMDSQASPPHPETVPGYVSRSGRVPAAPSTLCIFCVEIQAQPSIPPFLLPIFIVKGRLAHATPCVEVRGQLPRVTLSLPHLGKAGSIWLLSVYVLQDEGLQASGLFFLPPPTFWLQERWNYRLTEIHPSLLCGLRRPNSRAACFQPLWRPPVGFPKKAFSMLNFTRAEDMAQWSSIC